MLVLAGAMLQGGGLPLPAQTILLAAGVSGAILGSQIGHLIGRKAVVRPFSNGGDTSASPGSGSTGERLDRAEGLFEKYERRAVFAARFVPVLETFGYLAAGIIRMPRGIFLRYDLLGTTVWAAGSILAGYLVSGSVMSLVE